MTISLFSFYGDGDLGNSTLTAMKKFLQLLTAIALLLLSQSAFADWVGLGAAARCDIKQGFFGLVPVVETSSAEYNVPVPAGYMVFKEKANQNFRCRLDGMPINLVISVWGPSATGMGQGAGVVIIESLSIGKKRIFPYRTNFLWQVVGERVLTSIHVRRGKENYQVQFCYSNGFAWDVKKPLSELKCGDAIESN